MTLVRTEPIIDVEDVVVVVVVVPLVVHRLARLRQHPARIVRRLILELRVADVVRIDERRRELLQRLHGESMVISFGHRAGPCPTSINESHAPTAARRSRLPSDRWAGD